MLSWIQSCVPLKRPEILRAIKATKKPDIKEQSHPLHALRLIQPIRKIETLTVFEGNDEAGVVLIAVYLLEALDLYGNNSAGACAVVGVC